MRLPSLLVIRPTKILILGVNMALVCLLSLMDSVSCRLSSVHHFSELQASRRAAVGPVCYTRDEKCPCHAVTLPRLFAYFICDWETPVPSDLMLGQSVGDDGRITYPIFSFSTAVFSYFSIRLALATCLAIFLSFCLSLLFAYKSNLHIIIFKTCLDSILRHHRGVWQLLQKVGSIIILKYVH